MVSNRSPHCPEGAEEVGSRLSARSFLCPAGARQKLTGFPRVTLRFTRGYSPWPSGPKKTPATQTHLFPSGVPAPSGVSAALKIACHAELRAREFICGTGFQPVFLRGKHGLETHATQKFTRAEGCKSASFQRIRLRSSSARPFRFHHLRACAATWALYTMSKRFPFMFVRLEPARNRKI